MWNQLEEMLHTYYDSFDASHDMAHVRRVYYNAMEILKAYPEANQKRIILAVALHDVEDKKYTNEQSTHVMTAVFNEFHVTEEEQAMIRTIIDQVSFSGGKEAVSLEAQIVQDADRLDALGAIGIARTFAFGGAKGRGLYNHQEVEAIRKGDKIVNGSSITHFYEKLLLVKDRMNTTEARKLADERHLFMEQFLQQFYKEIGDQPCHN